MQSFWDQVRHHFTGPQLPWMILWLGLAALIVGLIVLTRTSWGQSHPLQKCAVMSLLAHLLLAAYATTFEIVTAGSPDGVSNSAPVSMILVNDGGDVASDAATTNKATPWDQLVSATPTAPATVHLDNPVPLAAADSQPAVAHDPLESTKPLLDKLPAMLASLVKPTADPIVSSPAPHLDAPATPAAAIEAVKPRAAEPTPAPQPDAASPPRQSTAASDAVGGETDKREAANNVAAKTIVPGPDAFTPPEVAGLKGAEPLSLHSAPAPIGPAPLAAAPIDKVADSKSSAAPASSPKSSDTVADNHGGSASGESRPGESRLVMVPVPGASASSSRPAPGATARPPSRTNIATAPRATGRALCAATAVLQKPKRPCKRH